MASYFRTVFQHRPNRDTMLSGRLTEKQRRDKIRRRAEYLVKFDKEVIPPNYPKADWPSRGWWKAEEPHYAQYPWTVDRLHNVLKYHQIIWQQSADCKELTEHFRELGVKGQLPNVDRIVCFGFGQPGGSRALLRDDTVFKRGDKSCDCVESKSLEDDGAEEFVDEKKEALFARYGDITMGKTIPCQSYAAALYLAQLISVLTHGREIPGKFAILNFPLRSFCAVVSNSNKVWIQEPLLSRTDIEALKKLGM